MTALKNEMPNYAVRSRMTECFDCRNKISRRRTHSQCGTAGRMVHDQGRSNSGIVYMPMLASSLVQHRNAGAVIQSSREYTEHAVGCTAQQRQEQPCAQEQTQHTQ